MGADDGSARGEGGLVGHVRRLGMAPTAAIVMVAVMALLTVGLLGRGGLQGSRDAFGAPDAAAGETALEEFAEREFAGHDFEFNEFGDAGSRSFRMTGDVDTVDEVMRIHAKLGEMTELGERPGVMFLTFVRLQVSREAAPTTESTAEPGTESADGRPPLVVTLAAASDPDELRGLLGDERVWELRSLDVDTGKGHLVLRTTGCEVADDACFTTVEDLAVHIETAPYRQAEEPGVGHVSVYVPILDAAMSESELRSGARSEEGAVASVFPTADIHLSGPDDRAAAVDAFRRYFPWLQPLAAGMARETDGRPVRISPVVNVGVDGAPSVQLMASGNENEESFARRAEELVNEVLVELANLTVEELPVRVSIGWDEPAELVLGGCSGDVAADALEERLRAEFEEC